MFFNNKKEDSYLIKIGALLIHTAKIDEKYTGEEKEIIKKTLIELGAKKENLNSIINNAENIEKQSNQILYFTQEIKNMNEKKKRKDCRVSLENNLL